MLLYVAVLRTLNTQCSVSELITVQILAAGQVQDSHMTSCDFFVNV